MELRELCIAHVSENDELFEHGALLKCLHFGRKTLGIGRIGAVFFVVGRNGQAAGHLLASGDGERIDLVFRMGQFKTRQYRPAGKRGQRACAPERVAAVHDDRNSGGNGLGSGSIGKNRIVTGQIERRFDHDDGSDLLRSGRFVVTRTATPHATACHRQEQE